MSEIQTIEEEGEGSKSPMESSSPEHVYETQANPNNEATQENLSNLSESLNLEGSLKSYLGKHILKDFEGTTYVGKITVKDKDDGTPFLQVRYEDGDTEEFVEEDLELLDELIEGCNMDINGLCHPRMFQSYVLQSLSLSDSQRDDGEWLQRRLIDHSSSN